MQTPRDSSRKGYDFHTMQYVSLLDLLQMLLENSSLFDLVRLAKLYCMKILRCILN